MPSGVRPPEAHAACVAPREHVRDPDAVPPQAPGPVLGMAEPPLQVLTATRVPLAVTTAHAPRVDSEDERAGTARMGLLTAPRAGWRTVRVRPQRPKGDGAIERAAR